MIVSKHIKDKIAEMAHINLKNRELSLYILSYLEDKKGVDTDSEKFRDAWSYIEGDCSPYEIIQYLEKEV